MSIAGDHLAESEYWKERALRAEAKLARPEGDAHWREVPIGTTAAGSFLTEPGRTERFWCRRDGRDYEFVMTIPALPTPQSSRTSEDK